MSIPIFDLIYSVMINNVWGSLALFAGFTVFFPVVLMLIARIPPFFTFLIASPVLLAYSQAGIIPLWGSAVVFIVFGLIWFKVTIELLGR